jgi:hypothetical protein
MYRYPREYPQLFCLLEFGPRPAALIGPAFIRSLDQANATFKPLRSFREIPIGRQQHDRFGDSGR